MISSGTPGVGDEHAAQIELCLALQAVFDIRLDAGFKRAAVFFADAPSCRL